MLKEYHLSVDLRSNSKKAMAYLMFDFAARLLCDIHKDHEDGVNVDHDYDSPVEYIFDIYKMRYD